MREIDEPVWPEIRFFPVSRDCHLYAHTYPSNDYPSKWWLVLAESLTGETFFMESANVSYTTRAGRLLAYTLLPEKPSLEELQEKGQIMMDLYNLRRNMPT